MTKIYFFVFLGLTDTRKCAKKVSLQNIINLNHSIMEKELLSKAAGIIAPKACPALDGSIYLRPDQTPYLEIFIILARKEYSNQEIMDSWDTVYAKKCGVPVEIKGNNELTKATEKLFEHLSAHEMKLHYSARLIIQSTFR